MKNVDGHVWNKRPDGLWVPDATYQVTGEGWCVGAIYQGIDFIIERKNGRVFVLAAITDDDSQSDWQAFFRYLDELKSSDRYVDMCEGFDDMIVGGLF